MEEERQISTELQIIYVDILSFKEVSQTLHILNVKCAEWLYLKSIKGKGMKKTKSNL